MACYVNICGDFEKYDGTDKGRCTPPIVQKKCGVPDLYLNEPQDYPIDCEEDQVGSTVVGIVEAGEISSALSVDDANALAEALAQSRAEAIRSADPCVWGNDEQCATDTCPEGTIGDDITVCIPINTYTSAASKAEADALALAEAQRQVASLRLLTPCVTEPPPDDEPVVFRIFTGESHTLFLYDNGELWGMGQNENGTLGDGTFSNRLTPILISEDVTYMYASSEKTLFIKSDKTLWGCGRNNYNENNPIDMDYNPVNVPHLLASDVINCACGTGHNLWITSDNVLHGIGSDFVNQLGQSSYDEVDAPVVVDTNVAFVSADYDNTVYVKMDGTIWFVGHALFFQNISTPPGLDTVTDPAVQMATGAIKSEQVYASIFYTKAGNELWGMGVNSGGELGNGTHTGIATPPTPAGWPPGLLQTNVVEFSAGFFNTYFVLANGNLMGCGVNDYGQLGLGSTTAGPAADTPVVIATNVDRVSGHGSHFVIFSKTDGSLWGCGRNTFGQLGNGTSLNFYTTPIQIL